MTAYRLLAVSCSFVVAVPDGRQCHCVMLASVVAVLGCTAQQGQSKPADTRASNGVVTMPLYDETAYFYAVKNRWCGLGDSATKQPGR